MKWFVVSIVVFLFGCGASDATPEPFIDHEERSDFDVVSIDNGKGDETSLRFDRNSIVSDAAFEDSSAMSAADVQAFLETASYCTPFHGMKSKRFDFASNTLIRNPLRLPRRRWTASSSPRFTRCNTV